MLHSFLQPYAIPFIIVVPLETKSSNQIMEIAEVMKSGQDVGRFCPFRMCRLMGRCSFFAEKGTIPTIAQTS